MLKLIVLKNTYGAEKHLVEHIQKVCENTVFTAGNYFLYYSPTGALQKIN